MSGTSIAVPTSTTGSSSHALDVATLLKVSRALTSEIVLQRLLRALIETVMENAGARRCCVLLEGDDGLRIEGVGQIEPASVTLLQSTSFEDGESLASSVVMYVARTGEDVVLSNASSEGPFTADPYVRRHGLRSLLCTAIVHHGVLSGVLYLENNLVAGAFTRLRLRLLRQVAVQIASAIENARLYQRLDQARARAEDAALARTNFLRTMSHELRTPLNVVVGYSALIREAVDDGDMGSLVQDAAAIELVSTRLARTFNGILELVRLESGEAVAPRQEVVSLRDALARAGEEVSAVMGKRGNRFVVQVTSDHDDAGAGDVVQTDSGMLHFCLVALLDNAARFTSDGTITARLHRGEEADRAWREIEVEDTGIGIADEDLERIFAAFQQVDGTSTRVHEGAGVSLAVARRFAHLVGGQLTASSELGVGSRFRLRLPVT